MACGPSFITAAFRSAHEDEAYIFLKNKYVVDNYCPGRADDKILYGPVPNSEGLKSLKGTVFGEYGIDCAFASHDTGKAYIFAFNDCALLDYAPFGSGCDKLIQGPINIATMFPYLKGTVFENGVDAAFESSRPYEAYLFKGDQYARINYGPKGCLMNTGPIAKFFPCFKGTTFECNIGGAFASVRENEAYVFKGEYYGHLKFTPGQTNDVLNGGVRKIKDYWPQLAKILPQASSYAN